MTPTRTIHELEDRVSELEDSLAAIREACNLPADIPHNEIADAIRECMTERPSVEAIHQMVTYPHNRVVQIELD